MIEVKVEGLEEVKKALEKAAKKSYEETVKGVELACQVVEKRAKQNAPVDTDRLRSSITYKADKLNGMVGTNVEYAPYQEFGTSRMKAHPFLLPGLYESKSEIIRIFRDIMKGIKL